MIAKKKMIATSQRYVAGLGVARVDAQLAAPAFEVATIKPNRSVSNRTNLDLQPGGRFVATNVELRMLIGVAYGEPYAPLPLNRMVVNYRGFGGGSGYDSNDRFDIVAVNSEGVTFAFDSGSGVSLWNARRTQRTSSRGNGVPIPPLIIRARSGVDNVIVMSGATVTKFEGATGRELWHAALSAAASAGAVLETARGSLVFIVDNSLQRMFLLDGLDGNIVSQLKLPQRVVGGPATFIDQSSQRILLAFANGRIEVRDETGAVLRSGDAGSAVTTAPLFVKGSHALLVMVGTKNGLTALNADDLRPLGRVAIKDDAPRGTLAAEDLNADGVAEVLMVTQHGRVVAVNAADGQILWNADVGSEADGMTFADVNGDGVIDVVVATSQVFALALSGRDGSIVWRDSEDPGLVANHATSLAPRSIVALSLGKAALLVSGDTSRTGLRAVELPNGSVPPKH